MVFQQVLQDDLGCASYLIADGGEAVVVDPQWEIGAYLDAADAAGVQICHVVETHNHADHVSGRRRLVAATGAEIHLPADPDDPAADGLTEGDVIRVGDVEVRAIAAPGHRPEHLAFAVTAPSGEAKLLTGDSLLVGGVARPDLAVAADAGADALFDTLLRYKALDPATEVWPAHVGASLCGSGSDVSASGGEAGATSSTIADELGSNVLLALDDRDTFTAELTAESPPRPPRVTQVVALNLNRAGAPEPPPLPTLDPAELADAVRRGATLLDIRGPEAFDAGHLTGALNLVPAGSGLGNRAGWATLDTETIVLIAAEPAAGLAFAERLYAAGTWNLLGVAAADPAAWERAGLSGGTATALTPELVAEGLAAGRLELLDVRDPSEWRVAHVAGSRNLPLSVLGDGRAGTPGLDPHRHYAVACGGGARAALAASILRRAGQPGISRMTGGIATLLSLLPAAQPPPPSG